MANDPNSSVVPPNPPLLPLLLSLCEQPGPESLSLMDQTFNWKKKLQSATLSYKVHVAHRADLGLNTLESNAWKLVVLLPDDLLPVSYKPDKM